MANKKPNILTTTIIVLILILIVSIGTIFVVTQSAIVEDFKMYDSFSADNVQDVCTEEWVRPFSSTERANGCVHEIRYPDGTSKCLQEAVQGYTWWTMMKQNCNNDVWQTYRYFGGFYSKYNRVGMVNVIGLPEITFDGGNVKNVDMQTTHNFMGQYAKIKGDVYSVGIDCSDKSGTCDSFSDFKFCVGNFCDVITVTGQQHITSVLYRGTYIYEVIPSILDPTRYQLLRNDVLIHEGTFLPDTRIKLRAYKESSWDYIKYKVPFGSCSFGDNRILGMQTFVGAEGGREITEDNLIFQPLQYCINHPVLITTPDGSEPTSEPYILLSKGGSFTLKEDQTALFFYTFYNDGSIPQVCTDGQFYDADNKECRTIGGVVILCTDGVFDPILGSCTVQPEVQYICNESQRYNTVSKVCEQIMPVRKIPAEECKGELVPTDEGFDCYIDLEDVYECEGTVEIINDIKVCIITLETTYEECAGNIVEVDEVPECRIDLEDVFECEGTIKSVNGINICVTEIIAETKYVPEDCDGTLIEQDDGTFICKTQPKEVYECVKGTLIDGKCVILIEDSIVERLYSNTPIMLFIGGLSLVIIVLVVLLIIKKRKR